MHDVEVIGSDTITPVKKRRWRDLLGPGLITGASDDDPSGIATYSQVGAQFGYGMSWADAVQLSADVRHPGDQRAHRPRHRPRHRRQHPARTTRRWLVYARSSALLLLANIINLGADLGAMGAALRLLIGGPAQLYVALFGVVCALLEIFVALLSATSPS